VPPCSVQAEQSEQAEESKDDSGEFASSSPRHVPGHLQVADLLGVFLFTLTEWFLSASWHHISVTTSVFCL
jgi:hypothetical protein